MENQLAKRESNVPAYIQESMQTIEGMMKYADVLLKSKLCPKHFYETGADNKPDYNKGKPEAVLIVLQHGMELGLSTSQSLQLVIPVNGLISIKGDGGKSLVFNSGVLKEGSWKEERTGSIEGEDYKITITSTRSDNGITKTSDFSVIRAKRAGLWINESQTKGQDGWKYKKSAWWKYPERMCDYRALGFHLRDLYPDILAGMYTLEEAQDMPQDTTEVIETPSGATITIPDKEHVKERSENLTSKASKKIAQANVFKDDPIPEEVEEVEAHVYTDKELHDMDIKEINNVLEVEFPELLTKLQAMPGKNTNKKLRLGILALQAGRFDEYESQTREIEDKPSEQDIPEDKSAEDREFEENMGVGGPPDETKEHVEQEVVIHHGVTIGPVPESGSRAFPSTRAVFAGLQSLGLRDDKYKEIAAELVVESSKETFVAAWTSMEIFSKMADTEHVVELIDVYKSLNA